VVREGRWTTVTASQFQHERQALEHIQRLLPDAEPYRAWSNFTFTASTGHVREVDLFVATRTGLYLIEIKSLVGRLIASGSNWIQVRDSGDERVFDNPLHLADLKAKQLRSLLEGAAGRLGGKRQRVPYIKAAVFLSNPALRVALPEHQLHWVYGPERAGGSSGGAGNVILPSIWSDLLGAPLRDERHLITPDVSKSLERLLPAVGIERSRRHQRIGSWELEIPAFESGPTWQDHLARHAQLPSERRRIRIYLVERSAGQADRASIEAAARREMLALHGINHPGIVQVDAFEQHEAGPALVFRHRPEAMRLDHYLARYGARLDAGTRLDMIRQLAEAMVYAHGRHLYHRALAARSVLVLPSSYRRARPAAEHGGKDDAAEPSVATEQGWLAPKLQISDWQAAARDSASSTGNLTGTMLVSMHAEAASRVVPHLEISAAGYLAPELDAPNPDAVGLDVFGLGALAYLILTGSAPAASRRELLTRLDEARGLHPSAVIDSVSDLSDDFVSQATRPVPTDRPGSVRDLLDLLEVLEDELTAPRLATQPPTGDSGQEAAEPEPDPLDARPGELVGGEWRIRRRLGTGSTSRAFLADNEKTGREEVLKVALSDDRASRLEHEASVLRRLGDSRVIRLARQEPLLIGDRWVLVLEHAGERTVARKLRDEGRLTIDELETYSDYLFGAVDYLEGEGVTHRDLKPDNIVIRKRQNRTYQLVLIDFSLAGISVREIEAGTPRYLDPFLGTGARMVYDDHAERYALAVTLHEMASGELPLWADGSTRAQFTEGPPTLATEAFDPAVRDGLTSFFLRALDRDASARFSSLKEMRDSWFALFRAADSVPPVRSDHPATITPADDPAEADADAAGDAVRPPADEAEAAQLARDEAAARATPDTPLEAAGLSPRAISVAHRLNATTVGALLALGSKEIISLPGTGQKTRRELQNRIAQWRRQTAAAAASGAVAADDGSGPADTASELPIGTSEADYGRLGVDVVAARLLPRRAAKGGNATEAEATRLLLGLPDTAGTLPDLPTWPQHQLVAARVGVTPGRIAQVLSKQRRAWSKDPVIESVRTELVALLTDGGRVMGFDELATAVLARRGSAAVAPAVRRALSAAVVRAAIEVDGLTDEPRLWSRRHYERTLVVLEATDDDGPFTPAAPALFDYAIRLGRVADRLAKAESLPAPGTVLRELAAVPATPYSGGAEGDETDDEDEEADGGAEGTGLPAGAAGRMPLDEQRLVRLAAAASKTAAATARLEIYPRDLDPERALRLAQAGVISPRDASAGDQERVLTVAQVHDRVRARFPDLATALPEHPALDDLLTGAGFAVSWDAARGGYLPRGGTLSSAGASSEPTTIGRQPTHLGSRPRATAPTTPEEAAAHTAERRLLAAAEAGGFRALTVRRSHYLAARAELARPDRFAAELVDVAALFLAALHTQVDPRPKPTWATILRADAAEPGSKAARNLAGYVDAAWAHAAPRLRELVDAQADQPGGQLPLLLHDAGVFGRYRGLDLLGELAELARSGGRPTWVLCPTTEPGLPPRLDGELVQLTTESEWIPLWDSWVSNVQRADPAGGKAS
jgi:serine/threonine protein kinase